MYATVTQSRRNGMIIDFEISVITEAVREAFEAEDGENILSYIGHRWLFCGAGSVPAGQDEEVCVADNFYAEDRLTLNTIMNTFSRRAAKPRRRFKGGHLIFPYFLYGRKGLLL